MDAYEITNHLDRKTKMSVERRKALSQFIVISDIHADMRTDGRSD